MSDFERAFKQLLHIEGGYSDNKYDRGGKTKYGITEALARAYGYEGDMRDLSIEKAKEIYKKEFWDALHLDLLENYEIKYKLFDIAVNTGSKKMAVKFLQRSCNLFIENQISEDGILGNVTASVVNSYKFPHSILKAINILQGMFYISLAEGDDVIYEDLVHHSPKKGKINYRKFIRGWIEKRIEL